jgi:hypothetical protein
MCCALDAKLLWLFFFPCCNFCRSEGVLRAFAEKGADIATTPHNLADAYDVVITMLPSSPHVKRCLPPASSNLITIYKPPFLSQCPYAKFMKGGYVLFLQYYCNTFLCLICALWNRLRMYAWDPRNC